MSEHSRSPKPILYPHSAARHFSLERYAPSPELASLVEHIWVVRWDLPPNAPYMVEILPDPNVNLTFTAEEAVVTGVLTKRFRYELSGSGVTLGMKFRCGGLYPFLKQSIATLTDTTVAATDVFPLADHAWKSRVLGLDDAAMVADVERLLLAQQPDMDAHIDLVQQTVQTIVDEHSMLSVQHVAHAYALAERTLQHLFRVYVGVGVKWIIMRYRVQDAADAIHNGNTNWLALSGDLGYADQAHFIRDFTAIIGKTPTQYARDLDTA